MSSFTWLSYSEAERERTRDLISQFSERDTRDELGIGRIRDAFADLLFPGTTTIQTRAKYFLFIPWMYLDLEDSRISSTDIESRARRYEVRLIEALLKRDDPDGVIGRYSKRDLQRLPSNIYWAGLSTWDIRRFSGSQSEYHDSLDIYYERQQAYDEDGAAGDLQPNWDPGLPDPPDDFPDSASLDLREQDAEYLRDRIMQSAPDSMLKELLHETELAGNPDFPWQYPHRNRLSDEMQEFLHHARNFSETMHGASLLYNLMLAKEAADEELIEEYSTRIEEWAQVIGARLTELRDWDLDQFWRIVTEASANTPTRMQRFVTRWIEIATDSPGEVAEDDAALRLIENRERRLKGGRARLHHQSALEQWSGEAGTGQLAYRWDSAKLHLQDIFAGLRAG
jgi:hypothetical protein